MIIIDGKDKKPPGIPAHTQDLLKLAARNAELARTAFSPSILELTRSVQAMTEPLRIQRELMEKSMGPLMRALEQNEKYFASMRNTYARFNLKPLKLTIDPIVSQQLQATLSNISTSLRAPWIDLQDIAVKISWSAQETRDTIADSEFAWCINLMELEDLIYFVDTVSEGNSDMVNQIMVSIAGNYQLHKVIFGNCKEIPYLNDRVKVLRQALAAHRRGQHSVSSPILIIQIEGILKAYGQHGPLQIKKRELERIHLRTLMERLGVHQTSTGKALTDFFSQDVWSERNKIIHGWCTDYGTELFSAQIIWILLYTLFDIVGKSKPEDSKRHEEFSVLDYLGEEFRESAAIATDE